MSRYKTLKDGEGLEIENGEIIKFACCDCGLIHDIAFAIEENGKIGIALRRNKRATAGRRQKSSKKIAEYAAILRDFLNGKRDLSRTQIDKMVESMASEEWQRIVSQI